MAFHIDVDAPRWSSSHRVLLASFVACFVLASISFLAAAPRPQDVAGARAHLEAALNAQKRGQLVKAAEEYRAALKIIPGSAEIHQNLGLVYHLQNRFQDAILSFEKALSLEPALWASNLFLGIACYKTNQFDRAVGALSKALELNSEAAELEGRFWLGVTYKALGRPQDAARELEKRLARSPEDIEVLYNLSDAYRTFAPEKSVELLRRMLALDPQSYRVKQMEGEVFEQQEKYPQALAAYQEAHRLKPDLPGIRFALGSVYWKMRQFNDAQKWLREELDSNPYHAVSHYELGNIYVYQNQPGEAIFHLQKALEAKVLINDVRRDLGKAYLQQGRFEEAVEQFSLVAAAEPNDDAIHALLASAYRKQGKHDEEKRELELFQELNQKKLERVQRQTQNLP
ncbi:MAG: tetratricopeptide repeat protein [Acidobacteriota bacterium]